MEQEDRDYMSPGPGLCGSDRELFARVWRRVMPEDREDCPIRLLEPEAPVQSSERPADSVLLQRFIAGERNDARTYRALARRTWGRSARILSQIADDEQSHAKRLSTAYFILTGIQLRPPENEFSFRGSYPGVLRRRLMEEQAGAEAYRRAAADASDPWLRETYGALAEDELMHARQVFSLLEAL